MRQALALLEFTSVAAGVLAVDRLLKRSPVAQLKCGTVEPGRYLALIRGTVAAVEEAHAEGVRTGTEGGTLADDVCLADPHPALLERLFAASREPAGEALGVLEIATSPALLRALDAVLKAVPVGLAELRLADDLGGRAVAVLDGTLPDVQEGLDLATRSLGECGRLLGASLLPRLDETLRRVLGGGTTRFDACAVWDVAGAETLED